MLGRQVKVLVFVLLMGLGLAIGSVQGADLTGAEILDSLNDTGALTSSGSAQINLTTVNARGAKRPHRLQVYRSEADGAERQLLEYLEPADVRGTKFLSVKEKNEEEAQMWLFLPALGRERRIAAHMTGDRFMGTDFTYEEIGGAQSYRTDYQATRLADEVWDGYDCFVLNLKPIVADSPYSQVQMWVWQDERIPLRVAFYDLEGRLQKTLTLSELVRQDDGDYLPHHLVMADEINNTHTIIEILETKQEDIPAEFFSLRYLRR